MTDEATPANAGQKRIEIFVEGTDSAHREAHTGAANVAALKTEMGLSGTISVNNVLANDNTEINDGDKVTVVGGNKTGGSCKG
jgi:hypothetical protein